MRISTSTNLLIGLGLLALSLSAGAAVFEGIGRDASRSLVRQPFSGQELGWDEALDTFSGFRIVRGTEHDTKSLNQLSDEERLRVVTLAYHLGRARRYFESTFSHTYLQEMGPITVRYDMSRCFSVPKHFTDDDKCFNDAGTQPASTAFALTSKGVEPWGIEIWFHRAKEVELANTVSPEGSQARAGVVSNSMGTALEKASRDAAYLYSTGFKVDVNAIAANRALESGLLILLQSAIPGFVESLAGSMTTSYQLETSLVPEVIYHEMAHVALSDFLPVTGSYALNEGYANYFAIVIASNGSNLTENLGDFGKNVREFDIAAYRKYRSGLENNSAAQNPFTASYLWKIRATLAKELVIPGIDSAALFDRIVFSSRKVIALNEAQGVRSSLPKALKQAAATTAREMGLDPAVISTLRLVISKTANDFGM